MSNQSDEPTTGISDEDLPEDLQPSDDNPLAKPLSEEDDAPSPEELDVLSGKTPEQSDDGGSETDTTDDSED
ncbi:MULTISPECIES: hypothetical protein [unclassified Nocardioides]|uniref:hypothetical protein n=1 Tax=unclassified Nocardioides TaxID=2615069 RepID=UPI0009F07BB0|nr:MULTISPECIES: hypothetical protein [unclassified Nocardioides]GAW49950.1 uncharacterized protein PD653B2_2279 [Nocardioides sp. PD653-B2]GAW55957.1 uncharacterized protein PD653_3385 [Nocardioides sp. PD653]